MNFDLTSYYAKRIIGDSSAATATKALLQIGTGVTANTWLLHRTNRSTKLYGIKYVYDSTNAHDKIELYGASTATESDAKPSAWVQLDTGETTIIGDFNLITPYARDVTHAGTSFQARTIRFKDSSHVNVGVLRFMKYDISNTSKPNENAFQILLYSNKTAEDVKYFTFGTSYYNAEAESPSSIPYITWSGGRIDNDVYPYTNEGYSLGSTSLRWNNVNAHHLVLGGTTNDTMDSSSTNPRITFQEGTSSQPVHLVYTDYNTYRTPAGLKVIGDGSTNTSTGSSPAWFEVEGYIYNGSPTTTQTIGIMNQTKSGSISFYNTGNSGGTGDKGIYLRNAANLAGTANSKEGALLAVNQNNEITTHAYMFTDLNLRVNGLRDRLGVAAGSSHVYRSISFKDNASTTTDGTTTFTNNTVGYIRVVLYKENTANSTQIAVLNNKGDEKIFTVYSPFRADGVTTEPAYITWTDHRVGHEILPYADNNSSYNLGSFDTSDGIIATSSRRWYNIFTMYTNIWGSLTFRKVAVERGVTLPDSAVYNSIDFVDKKGTRLALWDTYYTKTTQNETEIGKTVSEFLVQRPDADTTTSGRYRGFYIASTINDPGVVAIYDNTIFRLAANRYYTSDPSAYGMSANNSDIVDLDGLYWGDTQENFGEGLNFYRTGGTTWDSFSANNGIFYFGANKAAGATFAGDATIYSGSLKLNGNDDDYSLDITGETYARGRITIKPSADPGTYPTSANYAGRSISPGLVVESYPIYSEKQIESETYFMNNVGTAGNNTGYYIYVDNIMYGRYYPETKGTTSVEGWARLILGNDKNATTAGNSSGKIQLYNGNGGSAIIYGANGKLSNTARDYIYGDYLSLAQLCIRMPIARINAPSSGDSGANLNFIDNTSDGYPIGTIGTYVNANKNHRIQLTVYDDATTAAYKTFQFVNPSQTNTSITNKNGYIYWPGYINNYIYPYIDNGYSVGGSDYRWTSLWLAGAVNYQNKSYEKGVQISSSASSWQSTFFAYDKNGAAEANRIAVEETEITKGSSPTVYHYLRAYAWKTSSTEQTYLRLGITSDATPTRSVYTNGHFYAEGDGFFGTTTRESETTVYARSNSGNICLYSTGNANSNGGRGIWFSAHGTLTDGTAITSGVSAILCDTNNNITFRLTESTYGKLTNIKAGANEGNRTWTIPATAGDRYFMGTTSSSYTVNQMFYAPAATYVSQTPGLYYIPSADAELGTTKGKKVGIFLVGNAYGNTAANLGSNTVNVFTFGDPGPQIRFATSMSANEMGAIIWSDHSTSNNVDQAFYFVGRTDSNNTSANVGIVTKTIVARTRLTVGDNYANTTYTLYVNGSIGSTSGHYIRHPTTDLTAANNGSSDTLYTPYSGQDKNGKTFFAVEGISWSNGNTGAGLYVRNYTTSGDATGWSGILLTKTKTGTMTCDIHGTTSITGGLNTTDSINITKAGECGTEVENTSQSHKVAFIVGGSGNGGIYDRTNSKWIVYSDTSGNVVLNGNANTATTADKVIHTATGVSYINGAKGNNAAVYAKKATGSVWYPTICLQTAGAGAWQIGNYNDETLEFQYATATNITNGTNTTSEIYMQNGDTGRVLTSGNYSSYALPLSGGAVSGTIYFGVASMDRAILAYSSTYPKFGIWYKDSTVDTMRFSASSNADTDAGADLCINGNGAGTVTIRGNTILHAGNYSSYALPISGGTLTGALTLKANQYYTNSVYGLNANNSDIIGLNRLQWADTADTFNEGIMFVNGSSGYDCMAATGGAFYFRAGTDGTPAVNEANATASLYAANFYGTFNGGFAPYASIGSGTTDHGVALKNWFSSNKTTAPRNKLINFYSSTSGNGSQYMGYFLSGYADNPYGGFFVCHYNNPYYVGIQNGTYTQQHILTSTNYTSYAATSSHNHDTVYLKLSGGTMTGNGTIKQSGGSRWNFNDGTQLRAFVGIDTANTIHGLYSYGYATSASAFTSDAKWMIYRNSSGTITVNGNCTGSAGSVTWANVSGKPTFASANTASAVVQRDSSGNFTAGTITATRLIATSTTDADPASNKAVALLLGSASGGHMEIDNNEILAKTNASTLGSLYLQNSCYVNASGKLYNAVWNDFAEYRISDVTEPGRVVISNGKGEMILSTVRLQPCAHVISDTYGVTVGESDQAKTPIGVAGRVLVIPYQNKNNYKVGDCLCAAPNGTADIMTREEIIKYPDRIIGIVDEIPDYEVWEQTFTTGKHTINMNIEVKGRIWIYVR